MMGFWEEQAEREADELVAARLPQNAPQDCCFCGHVGTDVFLGICQKCAGWD